MLELNALAAGAVSRSLMEFSAMAAIPNGGNGKRKAVFTIAEVGVHSRLTFCQADVHSSRGLGPVAWFMASVWRILSFLPVGCFLLYFLYGITGVLKYCTASSSYLIATLFRNYGAVALVAEWLQSFKEFPPRQRPASFNLDEVMRQVSSPGPGQD